MRKLANHASCLTYSPAASMSAANSRIVAAHSIFPRAPTFITSLRGLSAKKSPPVSCRRLKSPSDLREKLNCEVKIARIDRTLRQRIGIHVPELPGPELLAENTTNGEGF